MDSVQRSSSAPSTPTGPGEDRMSKNLEDFNCGKGRKVQFPADEEIVTKYFDAPDPWSYLAPQQFTPQSLVDSYKAACEKQGIKPLPLVVTQLQRIQSFNAHEDLNLKGERLDAKSVEALEEIFKRIRFRCVNLESCNLDEEGASALFDMIEYYESASYLNIANNKEIDIRGWQACCRMLKKTPCLQHLDLRNCDLSEQVLLVLGRALRLGSHLVSLRLERSGISSRALAILVAALKLNKTLRYLCLGDNELCPGDAIQISNLLEANSALELLDLRDNNLQDEGLEHISEGLRAQSKNPGEGLKHLILTNNQITYRGMNGLVEALPYARSLRTINLNGNSLGDEGVLKLKEGVIMAPKLKGIGLKNCKINCQGAEAVAKCFAESDSLIRVDIRENNIKEKGLMALVMAAKQNPQIIRINFDSAITSMNQSSSSSLQALSEQLNMYCENNQKIQDNEPELEDQGLDSPSALTSLLLNGLPVDEVSWETDQNGQPFEQTQSDSEDTYETKASLSSVRKPIVRSSSLESWDSQASRKSEKPVKRSGRFSVSPVPDSESPPPYKSMGTLKRADCICIESKEDEDPRQSSDPQSRDSPQLNYESTSEKIVSTEQEKPKKRISFALPEETDLVSSEAFRALSKRRMSSPAVPTQIEKPKSRPKIPSLKMYKILDGLDLRSSVPLSPTRLYQSFEFPEPFPIKLPSKPLEPKMIEIAN